MSLIQGLNRHSLIFGIGDQDTKYVFASKVIHEKTMKPKSPPTLRYSSNLKIWESVGHRKKPIWTSQMLKGITIP